MSRYLRDQYKIILKYNLFSNFFIFLFYQGSSHFSKNATATSNPSDTNNTTEPHDVTKDAEIFLTIEQVAEIKKMMMNPEDGKRRKKRKVEQFDAYVQKWDLPIKYKFDPLSSHGKYKSMLTIY